MLLLFFPFFAREMLTATGRITAISHMGFSLDPLEKMCPETKKASIALIAVWISFPGK